MHTRTTSFRGWLREDGLWDIEAELVDAKPFPIGLYRPQPLPAGSPVHHLSIRLTVDEKLVVHAVATAMDSTPFAECQQAVPPMDALVGAALGPGWRSAIDRAMGGTSGCTHLRELLFNMATAAYQTIPAYRHRLRREAGLPEPESDEPPYHVGKCIAWDVDGPVVARHYPRFVGWQPLRRR
jgi:hypothetical protein